MELFRLFIDPEVVICHDIVYSVMILKHCLLSWSCILLGSELEQPI